VPSIWLPESHWVPFSRWSSSCETCRQDASSWCSQPRGKYSPQAGASRRLQIDSRLQHQMRGKASIQSWAVRAGQGIESWAFGTGWGSQSWAFKAGRGSESWAFGAGRGSERWAGRSQLTHFPGIVNSFGSGRSKLVLVHVHTVRVLIVALIWATLIWATQQRR
jgi:hypothetical protein